MSETPRRPFAAISTDIERHRVGTGWRRIVRMTALLCWAAVFAFPSPVVLAQDYPSRPIKLLVGYAPGGGSDLIARLVARQLQLRLGQAVVVENRPGAGGNIATDLVAKATPDGYTLLVTPNTIAMAPFLHAKLPFDVVRDLTGVGMIANSSVALVVDPKLPIHTVGDLIRLAKTTPGGLSYSTPGIGTPQHLAMELFKSATGTHIVHIPYKGGAPAVVAVRTGEVSMSLAAIPSSKALTDAGQIRAIATGDAQRKAANGLPPIGETVRGYEMTLWFGMMAPAGTPEAVVGRLNRELAEILKTGEVIEQMEKQGYSPAADLPSQMNAQIRADLEKWKVASRQAGIKPEQ